MEPAVPPLTDRFARAAIAHDWLTIPGGSERVVEALLELLPEADVLTSIYKPGAFGSPIEDHPIRASWLSRLPGATTQYPKLLPLMDGAWRRFDLEGYDLVLSSSHACAKNVRVPEGSLHVCYCYTPMRYAWEPAFLAGERLGLAGRTAFRAALPHLKRTDLRGASGVDAFVAISTVIAERIRRTYGREAAVVHPPVDVERYLDLPRAGGGPDAPYLVLGRVVPYKRVDLAVQACAQLDRPLVVAGDGRDLDRVRAMAGPRTTFTGRVSPSELADLLASSRALLFPGEEDFGIVPVEAMAAGLPVVGYAAGGVRDSVPDGVGGVLYEDGSLAGLVAAMERFEALEPELDEQAIREGTRRFAKDRFLREVREAILAAAPGDRRPAVPAASS